MSGTPRTSAATPSGGMAVVGMAGRFPGAADVDALWSMLVSGTRGVRRFSEAELRAAGVPDDLAADPDYVPYGAVLEGVEDFDAAMFGMTPGEARLTDPQQRLFLECAWTALQDAGSAPAEHGGRVGVFGSSGLSSYLLHHVLRSPEFRGQAFTHPVVVGNDKDFLATRVSYALDLHGPSVNVQTACSSSLVAVDEAGAALRAGRCDVALAGGASVFTPQTAGYRWRPGGPFSRDGQCRPFDAAASGMVRGNGCGVVVLKRLEDALADGDRIYAVVAASAVNNDGALKAGFSAPSVDGQEAVIRRCLEASGVPPSSLAYVEAHGTGTYLGDPVEVAALHAALEGTGDPPERCALGSVKANIGHLDAAAGVTGLIKAALVLHRRQVPPQPDFTGPNPELRLEETPFTVPREPVEAADVSTAAVTSLGLGGTNAHCVLTRAPEVPERGPVPGGEYVLRLSAPDGERVRGAAADVLAHLERNPETRLDDLAYTLARGRAPMQHGAAVRAVTVEEARAGLRELAEGRAGTAAVAEGQGGPTRGAEVGDTGRARKVRLPAVRLRRERHWIEAGVEDAAGLPPAGHASGVRAPAGHPPADGASDDPVRAAVEIFRSRLGIPAAGPDDGYYSLGGDSLHAIDVVDALRRRLDAPLTLEQFTRLKTPRAIAEWCRGQHDGDDGTLLRVKDGRRDATPVFLIHPSGGTTAFALALAEHSQDPGPLYGIGYPAELSRSLTSVPDMARHYARLIRRERPNGPYRVGGYSFGGVVALEVARLLRESGADVGPVLLWDSPAPEPGPGRTDEEFLALFPGLLRLTFSLPGTDRPGAGPGTGTGTGAEPAAGTGDGVGAGSEPGAGPGAGPRPTSPSQPPSPSAAPPRTVDEALEAVRQPGWTEATLRELRTMYTVWRVCDRARAAHRPRPYDGPVHLFAAEQPLPASALTAQEPSPPPRDPRELRDRWRPYLTGELRMTTVPGHHFSMFDAPRLPALAAAFDAALAEGGRTQAPPAPGPVAAPSALVFPGGGTQFPGMGRELLSRYPELVAEADEVLGWPVASVCAGDAERPLSDTRYSHPAIYVVNALALRSHLGDTGEAPVVALGHSLGEYNALEAAGVFTFADGLRLVAERATVTARIPGGMIAVSGLTQTEISALPTPGSEAPARLHLAAANAPRSHTLSGTEEDLDAATPLLLEGGARSVRRLEIGGPYHSPLMAPAVREFRTVLEETGAARRSSPPAFPVIANTTARPLEPGGLQEELTDHIGHTVLWQQSVERAVADHDPEFFEIGGRGVLLPLIAQVRAET